MAILNQINLPLQAYTNRAKNASAMDLVNLYAEIVLDSAKKSPSNVILFSTPGLKDFAESVLGDSVWGAHYFDEDGVVYLVIGSSVCYLTSGGTITIIDTIGTINANVQFEDNGFDVLMLDANGNLYNVTKTSLTLITDANYSPASSVSFLDGYFLFTELGTNKIFRSDANSVVINSAFANAEASPDKTVRGFATLKEYYIFGQRTIEIWQNNGGTTDLGFEGIQGGVIDRGCAAKLSIVSEANTLFFLGDDRMVYTLSGYVPTRISTNAIEEEIRKMDYIADAIAFSYTEEGHKFYIITFPTENKTFCFDITTQLWHKRKSYGINRWRPNCFVNAFGKNLVGDFESGKIFEITLDTYTDNGEAIVREAVFQHLFNSYSKIIYNALFLDVESGQGLITGQGSNPQVMLSWSDNGGYTYSGEVWRSLGQIGQYSKRVSWFGLGQATQRTFKFKISDPIKVAILGAYIDITECEA